MTDNTNAATQLISERDKMLENLKAMSAEIAKTYIPSVAATDPENAISAECCLDGVITTITICGDGRILAASRGTNITYTFGQYPETDDDTVKDIYRYPQSTTARQLVLNWQSLHGHLKERLRSLEYEHDQIFKFKAEYKW